MDCVTGAAGYPAHISRLFHLSDRQHFSLGIVQRLQKQDLTHGCKVAGTGTIDFDGAVGAIGGAKQKIIAAQRTGARYFLVPDVPDNVRPAMANRGDITVLPVKTLREALARLSRIKPCR